jgi:hypothetical protein
VRFLCAHKLGLQSTYSRLCSPNEEAFGEGTHAQHADSSNDGGDALKTKCALSREKNMSLSEVPHLSTKSKGIFISAAQAGRIEDKACVICL